jgi:hypothetical protein
MGWAGERMCWQHLNDRPPAVLCQIKPWQLPGRRIEFSAMLTYILVGFGVALIVVYFIVKKSQKQ